MIREVLFRGKAKTGLHAGEFIYGYYVKDFWRPRKGYGILPIDEEQGGYIEVDPETVGQYTGLRDCKRTEEYPEGQMIFEGDIIKGWFLHMLPVNAVVAFKDGAFGLEWYRGDIKTFNAFTSICNVEYEVIGNIHDTPELLN